MIMKVTSIEIAENKTCLTIKKFTILKNKSEIVGNPKFIDKIFFNTLKS